MSRLARATSGARLYHVPVRHLALITVLAATFTAAGAAEAESDFWEEMANPGITVYRTLVTGAVGRIDAGDYGRALVDLEQARALMPDEGAAWAWTAYAQSRAGQLEQAVQSWERVRALDPQVLDNQRLAIESARSLGAVGRFGDAAEVYGQLLSRGVAPRHRAGVLVQMGDMIVAGSCDDLDEAIDLFQEVVRDYPDHTGAHWRLAAALIRSGREDEAEVELTTALRLDPQWQTFSRAGFTLHPAEDVHFFRALGWEHLGNVEQAQREWRVFIEASGDDGCWTELASERLSALTRSRARRRR